MGKLIKQDKIVIKDQELNEMISGCIRGDLLMQKSFYYRFYPVLMRICIRYAHGREDAEQWVHDGFIKIFDRLPTYQHKGSFEGWVKRIMVRLCIDHLRAQNTRKFETENSTVYPDKEIAEDTYCVTNDFLAKTEAEDLLCMVNSLPDKQRVVFNLIVFEDYSHKEVASLLRITENHSYLLMHQARKHLKKTFQQQAEKKLKHEQK